MHSYTEPRRNLLDYACWRLEQGDQSRTVKVEAARESGRRLLAKLEGIDDRDAAAALTGAGIAVAREAMPALAADELYWADLEGLEVRSTTGARLGTVQRLLATGANDVLVLDGPEGRLIPFVRDKTVRSVDLEAGEIIVDWDVSFWD